MFSPNGMQHAGPAALQHGMMSLVDRAMKIAGSVVFDIPERIMGVHGGTKSNGRSAGRAAFNRRRGMKPLNRLSSEPGWRARQVRALPAR